MLRNEWSHRPGTRAKYVVAKDEVLAAYRSDLAAKREQSISDEWREIRHLAERWQAGEPFVLGCHCHPQPCHGDIIVRALEWAASQKAVAA